jgi:hypothetical protein
VTSKQLTILQGVEACGQKLALNASLRDKGRAVKNKRKEEIQEGRSLSSGFRQTLTEKTAQPAFCTYTTDARVPMTISSCANISQKKVNSLFPFARGFCSV